MRATVLSDEDLEAYPTRDSRRPLLEWPRAMPIEGEPADVVSRIEAYDDWLASSEEVPKLLLTFEGSAEKLMIGAEMTALCAANIANLEIGTSYGERRVGDIGQFLLPVERQPPGVGA